MGFDFSKLRLATMALLALMPLMGRGQAATPVDEFLLDSAFPSDPNPDGSAPYLTATLGSFTSGPNSGDVSLTLAAPGLAGSDFITDWAFNLNPTLDPTKLSFTLVSNTTGLTVSGISTGTNTFKSDGDGFYDIDFSFPTSKSGGLFNPGGSVTVTIAYSGLAITGADLLYLSSMGGGEGDYYSAAHIQGISAPAGSTWVGASGFIAIPEPPWSSMWVGAAALVGAASVWRRRTLRRE